MAEVLLTGATGFVGQHLLRELISAGHTVRGISRSESGDVAIRALGGEPVRATLGEDSPGEWALLQAAVEGCDAIFHTAADTTQWRPHNPIQTKTNVRGAELLLRAAEAGGVRRFLHTSSVSAYSHLVHGVLRETTPQRGGESWVNYERTKFLAETAVRGSKVPWVIFQPSHILGPGDTRNWARLILLVDQGKLPGAPPGSGAFADVRQIARAQVRAFDEGIEGETFLLGGAHSRFVALIGMIGERLGRPVPKRATPAWMLKSVAFASDALSRVTRKMPDITPEAAVFPCHDLEVDSSKAIARLGYRETPLPELLDATIASLRAAGLLRPGPAGRG
ncbi:MAG: NAD-dependent epimerase/dehydratase family protein [Silanimonas sp.]